MSINKVFLAGRLAEKPDIHGEGRTAVSNFTIVTDEPDGKDNEGKFKTRPEFIRCVAFGHQAEFLNKYMEKGSMVAAEGSWNTDKYEKDGQTKYFTRVKCNRVEGMSKGNGGGNAARSDENSQRPARAAAPAAAGNNNGGGNGDGDLDIPF